MSEGDITLLLRRWSEGDSAAMNALMPLVYTRLHNIALGVGGGGADSHIQATALVNEAFLKLVQQGRVEWEGREHFFSLSALTMRHILVDQARAHLARKRGGDLRRIPLHEDLRWVSVNSEEILDLNTALDELAAIDSRKAAMVQLRYFLGCTATETSEVLAVSKATVDRELDFARAWLFRRLRGKEFGADP
jgi:RNA polymerase sigma factor (TIGR02999 family)